MMYEREVLEQAIPCPARRRNGCCLAGPTQCWRGPGRAANPTVIQACKPTWRASAHSSRSHCHARTISTFPVHSNTHVREEGWSVGTGDCRHPIRRLRKT